MSNQLSDEEIYEEAKKRVKDKKDFYGHLSTYVVVNIMLILIWAFAAGGGYPWFLWCLGMWGIGIVFHFLGVFVFPKNAAKDRKAIEKEVERIKRAQG
jgi:hypothetical protein